MLSTLAVPSVPVTTTGDLFQAFNNVETFTGAVIARIPDMQDCDVVQTRERAKDMGKAAWRIECACDAEVLKRVHARGGRGNADTEGGGVMAAVGRLAADAGVSRSTILQNAQIHNTFFSEDAETTPSAWSSLEEKQFYTEALRASDPLAAIEAIAVKKADNPFYSTRDARRDIDPDFATLYDRTISLPPGVNGSEVSRLLSVLADSAKSASLEATSSRVDKAIKVLAGETTNIHVSDDSYEWYTPAEYLQAARSVMGGIDLDPASSHHAQEMVQAGAFFSRADDGLAQEWRGTVWLNPPYSSPEVDNFMDKLVQEYQSGHVSEAIALTNNSTDTRWFHRAASASSAMCFTKGRIGFWKPEAAPLAARQGQVFFYMGDSPEQFAHLFAPFGLVVLPYPAA